MTPPDADRANEDLVRRLIAEGALWSRPLVAAFRATPRHQFLDRVFVFQRRHNRWREVLTRDPGPEQLDVVYADRALITHLDGGPGAGAVPVSSSSQPSLMAQMLEDLRPAAGHRVLEVGAGTGYNAALLAHVAGPGRVVSVDVDRSVLSEAWAHLRAFADRRVVLQHADGREGYAAGAPYDRIVVTAATPTVQPAWVEQLADGGVLVAPLALAPGLAFVLRGAVAGGRLTGRLTRAAYFMPLRAEGEAGPAEGPPALYGETHAVAAPWAGWFDRRRPRAAWLGVCQALAFRGWLRGRTIDYRALADGEAAYGVGDGESVCWLGERDWLVAGPGGEELGRDLWHDFLEAGGPRPAEYEVETGAVGDGFRVAGPNGDLLWRLPEARERPALF